MVELQMENERVERSRLQQVGEDWIRAITDGDLDRLKRFCLPGIVSQLLTPKRFMNFDNVMDLIEKYRQWFGGCSDFQVENSRIELVGERLGIFYRFLLQEQGSWERIEQQLYCTMQGEQVAQLHLLCSGFQPVTLSSQAAQTRGTRDGEATPDRDALLVFHPDGAASGSTCALLTPAIKSKLREMNNGQVLEVQVDDPSAKEDIEAWCRLTGNSLLKMDRGIGQEYHFFLMKK